MTFDLNETHHHQKLASVVLLTKFGSHRALSNILAPAVPRDLGPPIRLGLLNLASPIHAPDKVWSKSDHVCVRNSRL